MFLKVHHSRDMGDVVAVCDRELLNMTIHHDNLTITIQDAFYGNTPATEDAVRDALKTAGNINLIGERSVNLAIRMGLIAKSGCIMIGDIPHAQIYQL
ncbi:MAG TPA: DUF424 domain-containing protein [Methanoregula sp.]|nr:DUF424 domain-containing protein [Methanoregula sp.]